MGVGPATVTSAAGACSHRPRQGLRAQPLSPTLSPAGERESVMLAQSFSAPAAWQAMSSQTWAKAFGRGSSESSA